MKIPFKQYIKLLSKYLKCQKLKVLFLMIILGVNIVIQLLNPQILKYFIDAATKESSPKKLTIAAIIFIGAAILGQFLNILATYVSQNVGWSATNELRIDLMKHCLSLDMSFHKEHQPGELLQRVDGDVTSLFNFFSKFLLNVLNNIILLVGIVLLLFREDWRVGLSLSLFAIISMIILWKIQQKSVGAWEKEREISAKFYGFLGEQIANTEDVRSCGAKNYVMYLFFRYIRKWYPISKKASMMYYKMWMSTLGLFAIGNIVAFGISGYLYKKGILTIGAVYLIFHYTELLSRPIEQIRRQLEDLQKAGASIGRVQELLSIRSKLNDEEIFNNSNMSSTDFNTASEEILLQNAVTVNVKNVCFEYEKDTPVLKDISFNLPKGKVLGILGRTGSGKTTLARMLVRLYDPSEGEIRFNGKAINLIPLKELRENIAYVTQNVELFSATVRDNLTFFDSKVKDDDILKIINDIGLNEWYERLPQGLDTILDAGGGGLSAGESQLLAFIRVFLKNPSLVILDEASSRLDPVTEKLMEKALNKLIENRTCIIIAHRLWTVQRADNILILDEGKVVEYGNRKKLCRNKESRFSQLLKMGIEDDSNIELDKDKTILEEVLA